MHAQSLFPPAKYRLPEHSLSSLPIRCKSYVLQPAYRSAMGFGKRLQDVRIERKLSGATLGQAIGYHLGDTNKAVTRATISHWENEHHAPSVEQLQALCAILKTSADWLVLGITPVGMSVDAAQKAREYDSLKAEERRLFSKLIEASKAARNHDESAHPDALLGGDSGLVGLDEIPDTKKKGGKK